MFTKEIVLIMMKAMVEILKTDDESTSISISIRRDGYEYKHEAFFIDDCYGENKWKIKKISSNNIIDVPENEIAALLCGDDLTFIENAIKGV